MTLDELFKIEIVNMCFNIYDKMDTLEKVAEKNSNLENKVKIRVK